MSSGSLALTAEAGLGRFPLPTSHSVTDRVRENARRAADMVGNMVAKVATRCRAEPGDLYAATHGATTVGRRPDLAMRGTQRRVAHVG